MAEEKEYYSHEKKFFDRAAPYYDVGTVAISAVRGKVVDFADARSGSKILDVGTGTGKQAFAFAKKGHDVIGIDLSEGMLKVANKKNRYENVKFEVADAANLPFENNSFDVSCVSLVLHEIPSTIREKVLKEMARVTKAQGMIMIVDYALPVDRIWRFLTYHIINFYECKYYSMFVKSDFKAVLRKIGIEIKGELPILLGTGRILKGINYK